MTDQGNKSITFNLQSEYENQSSGTEVKDPFDKQDINVSIRKIKNGFIVNRSWTEGTGDKREYKNEEEFFPENPL